MYWYLQTSIHVSPYPSGSLLVCVGLCVLCVPAVSFSLLPATPAIQYVQLPVPLCVFRIPAHAFLPSIAIVQSRCAVCCLPCSIARIRSLPLSSSNFISPTHIRADSLHLFSIWSRARAIMLQIWAESLFIYEFVLDGSLLRWKWFGKSCALCMPISHHWRRQLHATLCATSDLLTLHFTCLSTCGIFICFLGLIFLLSSHVFPYHLSYTCSCWCLP